jgi:hypothetical protein
MGALENDSHVYNAVGSAAGQGTHVHLAPLRFAPWHRGWNVLNEKNKFPETRDCQSIAGFLLEKSSRRVPGQNER